MTTFKQGDKVQSVYDSKYVGTVLAEYITEDGQQIWFVQDRPNAYPSTHAADGFEPYVPSNPKAGEKWSHFPVEFDSPYYVVAVDESAGVWVMSQQPPEYDGRNEAYLSGHNGAWVRTLPETQMQKVDE